MGDRAAEGTSLENWQMWKRFVSSNLTPSAIIYIQLVIYALYTKKIIIILSLRNHDKWVKVSYCSPLTTKGKCFKSLKMFEKFFEK